MSARQLRLVLETDDLDAAVAFYRDALGLPVQESYDGEGDARVVILGIPSATLELANRSQVEFIDRVEVGAPAAHGYPLTMRVALEVADAASATEAAVAGGAELVAAPVETPWRSLNARLEGPDGVALTLFQELD
ncbi:VOC family protein [Protaetiibacter mangrovi]|uniref:VOC family protein n=1 Tax=Protaetiibacter mangrovi TaxID=2970926 RepID=A0ABT1ZIW4_9MICO|nr:VOC family protein [Protaetiibacter mangrovi]MCS0500657.1 VOC family protein [Protaetiibacter mangrovi]